MSYLLTQMFLYLLVALILGLLLGWLIWRYGKASETDIAGANAKIAELKKERDDLKVNLDACRARSTQDRETTERLRAEKIDLQSRIDAMLVQSEAVPVVPVAIPTAAAPSPSVGTKPEGLDGPRGGKADALQEISGVGPKLEKLLHKLGYYHFDQIGAWSTSEVAWVDDNLEGFKGRVSRDNWISQAKTLAAAKK